MEHELRVEPQCQKPKKVRREGPRIGRMLKGVLRLQESLQLATSTRKLPTSTLSPYSNEPETIFASSPHQQSWPDCTTGVGLGRCSDGVVVGLIPISSFPFWLAPWPRIRNNVNVGISLRVLENFAGLIRNLRVSCNTCRQNSGPSP